MSGMGSGLNATSPTVVSAFHHALWDQFLVVLVLVVALAVMRAVLRARQLRQLGDGAGTSGPSGPGGPGGTAASGAPGATARVAAPVRVTEPPLLRVLRIGFGLLWLLDGILQGQSAMPLGMPSQVLEPAADGSPGWVVHLVHFAGTMWIEHPVTAAAAAVWIQVGIGLALLVAPPGRWARLAGLVSAGWGLVVWVFGEAFGGIFAPGSTWLFGTPGAVLLYVVAGLLLALPERVWHRAEPARWMLRGLGVFFAGMALLQAWPGRGFWQGRLPHHGGAAPLTAMVQSMAQTPQPSALAATLRHFAGFVAAHGWGVNLFAVVVLAVLGVGLLLGADRPRLATWAVGASVVACLADWLLVQDLGFFGGVGTDPNSMVPLALLLVAGWAGLRSPVTVTAAEGPAPETAAAAAGAAVPAPPTSSAPERVPALRRGPAYLLRTGAVLASFVVVLLGAVPMAVASATPAANPILAEAIDGTPVPENVPAPDFHLRTQSGRPVNLASFRGRVVAVTFLDPVCTNDCPVIAQEFRLADQQLGPYAERVALVAIVANPIYRSLAVTQAFDRQEDLTGLRNWYYLTGPLSALRQAWTGYGATVQVEPAGAMVDHSEFTTIVDPHGRIRVILGTDPGPATSATRASFSALLDQELRLYGQAN